MKLPNKFHISRFIFGNFLGVVFLLFQVQTASALDYSHFILNTIPFPTFAPFPSFAPLPTLKSLPTLPLLPTLAGLRQPTTIPTSIPSNTPSITPAISGEPTENPTETPTPTVTVMLSETPTPTVTPTVGPLALNEFLPHPTTGQAEWVELSNPSSTDLSTYWVDDDTDFSDDTGSMAKKSLGTLNSSDPQHPYIETSGFLNNAGDHVVLFAPNGSMVDHFEFTTDPGVDTAIGRDLDGTGLWKSCTTSTKGSSNNNQC